MTTALSVAQESSWTPEQIKLITDVVAKNATSDELKLFLYRAKSMGLDPLKPGQIYFIKYGNGPGTIVVGIEGFRAKAADTGKLSGIKRGALRDEKGQCIGAWAEVYRSDWTHPAREEVPLNEYNTGKGNWQKMPETMIKKVAEAAALRMAFPDHLGGVYTREEMDQADRAGIYPEQPTPEDGNTEPMEWKFSFGKWKGKTVEETYRDPRIGKDAMLSYINFLETSTQNSGKPLSAAAQEAIAHMDRFLGAMENQDVFQENTNVSQTNPNSEQDVPF